ncbi:aminopeptidase P family protein [Sedimentibacter sp. zth1]|uniref:M24 family metallopeptidase n=1 Tax=Sedimentibacter sp. zth1 TaxID=2816908 RepID=UPI001A934129|nr:Xaa-Pro peptidase family protein [Sedimentibacter sp. zth1]QSX06993.1 aminopeptidase P family protein [Sedimentibacter sp. zth1]
MVRKEYINKLVDILKKKKLDAMLICPSEEMEFLIGHNTHLCERFQALIIKNTGEYFYVCNLLTAAEIQEVLGESIKVYGWFDGDGYMDTVNKAFEENGLIGKTIGVNSTERACLILDIMENLDVKFINGKPMLEEMRIIKTNEEIENLRKASQITDETFLEILKFVKPGMKEVDVANFIDRTFIEKGAQPGFTLICSGSNSALPHYPGNQRVIEKKDILLLDFGCVYNNMCSDMTRTIFIGGVTEEERKMYEYVLEANIAGESKAVEGAYIPDIDKAARDVVEKSGYGSTFITRLGHGIGYSIHEAPYIKQSNKRKLEKGMAFSIEPGIYRVGEFGIRIEDLVVITDNGREVINHASKEIIVI